MVTRSIILFMLSLFASMLALAYGPDDALSFRDPSLVAVAKKLAAAKLQHDARNLGLGSSLGANRNEGTQGYSLNLSFEHNGLSILQAKRQVEQVELEYRRLEREGARDALLSHAAMWKAQAAERAALPRREAALLAKQEAERKRGLGGVADLDVEIASIDLADADLSLKRARNSLLAAIADGKRFGMTDKADPYTKLFVFPEIAVEKLPDYRDQVWECKLAQARQSDAKRDVIPALGIDVNKIGGDTQMSVSLSSRGPNGNMTLGYPSLYDPSLLLYGKGLNTTFKITLPVDPGAHAALKLAKAEVELTKTMLQTRRAALEITYKKTRDEAIASAEMLALTKERYDLIQRKHRAILAKAEAGAVSKLAVIRDGAEVDEAEKALAEAWQSYVQAAAAYYDLIDSPWEAEK